MILAAILVSSFAIAADATPTPTPPAAPAPAISSDPQPKELSAKDLTINGVTIGKSNLYNSVGKFGTNMFHKKEGGLSIVCWKGDDGTTLAFESEKGAKDDRITTAKIIASGTAYEFEKDCKTSKKVSAALSVAGVTLGETGEDLQNTFGTPQEISDDTHHWRYKKVTKGKFVISDIDVVTPTEKAASIAVHYSAGNCSGDACD